MNLSGLKEAIIARVQADTGSGGLWATGAHLINAVTYWFEGRGSTTGVRAAQPVVCFDVPTMEARDGYGFDLNEIYFRFHILYPFLRNKDAAITAADYIRDRLFGDATNQAARQPSYGFHRHPLVLTTTGLSGAPWGCGLCWRTNSAEAHGESELHFIETYRCNMARTRTLGYTS